MRVSVVEADPGYRKSAAGRFRVYLDGAELHDCFTADEEAGEAWVYVRDSDGRFVLEGDEVRAECLSGVVKIEPLQ